MQIVASGSVLKTRDFIIINLQNLHPFTGVKLKLIEALNESK